MRRALFVLSTGHLALKELRPVIVHFHKTGWAVDVRIGRSGPEARAAIEGLSLSGIAAQFIPDSIGYEAENHGAEVGAPSRPTGTPGFLSKIGRATYKGIKVALKPFLVHRLVAFFRHLGVAVRNRRWGEDLLRESKPDAVLITAFLSVGQVDNAVLRAANRNRIPVFCLTNSPYVGELPCRVARLNHLRTGMAGPEIRKEFDALNRFIAYVSPDWTRTLADQSIVFYWDPMRILASHVAGLGMNRMWCKPSMDFDIVFLFSEFSRTLLLESGFSSEKLVVAGQPLLDEIFATASSESRRREIAEHIGVPDGDPFLLVNIEPGFEHNYVTADEHWRHFHEVMLATTAHGIPVILSLHPLCRTDAYGFAEAKYGVRISSGISIHELYPKCSVSVSFPCSTNLIALDLGKPLVIYDFYDMVDRDAEISRLNHLPGAMVARNEEELRGYIAEKLLKHSGLKAARGMVSDACPTIERTVSKFCTAALGRNPRE